ncbi:unnamed protein product [Urochloa humidicola]
MLRMAPPVPPGAPPSSPRVRRYRQLAPRQRREGDHAGVELDASESAALAERRADLRPGDGGDAKAVREALCVEGSGGGDVMRRHQPLIPASGTKPGADRSSAAGDLTPREPPTVPHVLRRFLRAYQWERS